MRAVTLLKIAIVSSLLGAHLAQAQISEEEFIRRTVAHKIGVLVLCGEILKTVSTVNQEHVLSRCRAHDSGKIAQSIDFLETHKITKDQSIASYLASIYGKFVDEKQLNRGIIDEANRVDKDVAQEINRAFGSKVKNARLVDMIEHVADLTERGLHDGLLPPRDGVFERGRPWSLASEYIANNPVQAKIWTKEERDLMVKLATALESSATVKAELLAAMKPAIVDARTSGLLQESHYRIRTRARCFEAILSGL